MNNPLYSPLLYQSSSKVEKVLVENSDWSGRHVRLKYQMMVSSLALYFLLGTDVESISLFGFINYGDSFPEEIFFKMLLGFSFFSVLAFILRSFFEQSRWSSLRKDMTNLVANIKANEALINDVFKFKEQRAFALDIVSSVSEPNDDFSEEFVSKFDQLKFENYEGTLNELRGAIGRINNDATNLKNSLEHIRPGYHPRLTEYQNSLMKVSRQSTTISNAVENVEREIKRIEQSGTAYKEIQSNLIRYRNAIVALIDFLPELAPKSDTLQKTEFRRGLIYSAQNLGFSVFLPLFSAVALIALSLVHKFHILV
ncbi:MAG: hypothetical protein ABJO36_04260 [Litorimonas sp.]